MATGMMGRLLDPYKGFVRQHPGLVHTLEQVLHFLAWNPERFSSSEYAYEGFNAAVGLLALFNESILAEEVRAPGTPAGKVFNWSMWLRAVEQVQTLIELRAIQMEQQGKMSRYSPLIVLEMLKAFMRLRLWTSSASPLTMESPSPEDAERRSSQQQLTELMDALDRLRHRYDTASTHAAKLGEWALADRRVYNVRAARAVAVHAAAVAPLHPPPTCASADVGSSVYATPCASPYQTPLTSPSSSTSSMLPVPASQMLSTANGAAAGCAASCSQTEITVAEDEPDGPGVQQSDRPGFSGRGSAGISHRRSSGGLGSAGPDGVSSSNLLWGRLKHLYNGSSSGSSNSSSACLHKTGSSGSSGLGQSSTGGGGSRSSAGGSWLQRWCSVTPSPPRPKLQQLRPRTCGLDEDPDIRLLWRQALGRKGMQAGELLYILRPLIYVVLLRRYGLRSWRPWAVSLAIELLSSFSLRRGHTLREEATMAAFPPGSTLYSLALLRGMAAGRVSWSRAELSELRQRDAMVAKYLLRSPLYDAVTRRVLVQIAERTKWMPLVSGATAWGLEAVDQLQSYFTYMES